MTPSELIQLVKTWKNRADKIYQAAQNSPGSVASLQKEGKSDGIYQCARELSKFLDRNPSPVAPLQPREVVSSQATGWFHVKERLPEEGCRILMTDCQSVYAVDLEFTDTGSWEAWLDDYCLWDPSTKKALFWRFLPDLPDAPAALSEAESTEQPQQTESEEEGVG